MSFARIGGIFHIDMLSIMLIVLVSFIGVIIYLYSKRYMKEDALYQKFFRNMVTLLLSVILMTVADNLLLFLAAWCCCNGMLVRLIIHKSKWKAAKASGRLAAQNFILGVSFIILAFSLLYTTTGSLSIQEVIHHPNKSWYTVMALLMLLMGAMTQSAIWPFHRWLTSSLNSPTPVSALMHAGVVNGGGFLLARFAPLYFNTPKILSIIFMVGLISALLGSLWKLMQHDIKRMLACSTMGQMGFMLVQCGLGLFGSALAHLCWHGMFKAYLFLSSGGAAQEKRLELDYPPTFISFLCSLICAALGSYLFTSINNTPWFPLDSSVIIVEIVFITCAQLALTILRGAPFKKLPIAMIVTATMATLYGANVYLFDLILSPLKLMQPQPLNFFHFIALVMLLVAWGFILFVRYAHNKSKLPKWFLYFYIKAFNSSQPHPSTITTHRNGYNYV